MIVFTGGIMNTRELIYVKTVAEEKSISQACKKLYISQPSLSQAIQRIEEKLNSQLFLRTNNGLKLTLSGEYYYQAANQILKIYDDMKTKLSEINQLETGRINIGITSYLGRLLLPHAIMEMRQSHPNIVINISEDASENLQKRMESGEIDFSILHKLPDERTDGFEYQILSEEKFIVIASTEYTKLKEHSKSDKNYRYPILDLSALANDNFIAITSKQSIRQVSDLILKKADILKPNYIFTLQNYLTAIDLVRKNLGIAIFPEDYMHFYADSSYKYSKYENLEYYSIDNSYNPIWQLCIAYPNLSYLSQADLLFIDILNKSYEKSKKES